MDLSEIMKNKYINVIKIGVLVQKGGKLLLIKERYKKDDEYKWNIIKGSFEPGRDKNFLEAAHREAKEEANARIKIKKLLNIAHGIRNDKSIVQFNFVADLLNKDISLMDKKNQNQLAEDIIEVRLFSKAEIKKMKKNDFRGEWVKPAIDAWLRGESYDHKLIKHRK